MSSIPPSPFGSSLKFKRPAARGRASTNNLRQQPSSDDGSKKDVLDSSAIDTNAGMGGSVDTEMAAHTASSRTVSPAPSMLSSGEPSQKTWLGEASTWSDANAALSRFMENAHSGSFAVGALGQKLLDQQSQISALMDRVEAEQHASYGGSSSVSRHLLEQMQSQVSQMKEEQQKLVMDLLQASDIDIGALITASPQSADTHALITSLGMQMPDTSVSSAMGSASAAREMRRQKNAAAPNLNKDETLINDIQQQLIQEIRRLQALVAERDKALAGMSEALDEAARIKALHEASIKKLETEKDTQDANLYELEAKEAILREEHEGVAKQLKKLENDMRILKRQLAEKADAADSFKANNEELEEKLEDMKSNVATLRAKGAADQKTITGLKSQVNDYEVKARQALEKIPASHSGWSQSLGHENVGDMSAISATSRSAPDSPNGGGRVGAHNQALTPSASVDDALVNRLRPNDTIKNMEADIAKWKAAAFKYRKKWSESRKQGGFVPSVQEHDDSTDEDDENMWADEPAALSRVASTRSRIVSSASRRGKMGDAFGLRDKRASWQSRDSLDQDASIREDDDEDSNAGSVRGSIDGFDPSFADPTLRGGRPVKRPKRWSGMSGGNLNQSSPLARQIDLDSEPGRGIADDSFASNVRSPTAAAGGALGDELGAVQGADARRQEEVAAAVAAEVEAAVAERNAEHAAHIEAMQNEHAEAITHLTMTHKQALADMDARHSQVLNSRDENHEGFVAALQNQHAEDVAQQNASHAKALGSIHEKHAQALATRDAEHESHIAELERKLMDKHASQSIKQTQVHEQLMSDARQRHAETLTKHREEAEAALIAAQREHRKILEEREATHKSALQFKESEHGRAMLHAQRGYEQDAQSLRSSHAASIAEQKTAFEGVIAKKDAIIIEQSRDISQLRERLSKLEQDLAQAEDAVRAAEEKLKETNKKLASQVATRMLPSESASASDVFQDARENIVAGTNKVQPPLVGMRESSSQTDGLASDIVMSDISSRPLPLPEEEPRALDGMWLAKSSTIRRDRPSADTTSSTLPPRAEVVIPASELDLPTILDTNKPPTMSIPLPPSEMPPPAMKRQGSSKSNAPSRPTSPPPSDLLHRVRANQSSEGSRNGARSGPPPSSYMPPPADVPRRNGHKSTDSNASRRDYERSSISSRLSNYPRALSAQSYHSDAMTEVTRSDATSAFGEDERRAQELAGEQGRDGLPASTDPIVLGAITSAMIGTYMYKYTRRGMGRTNIRHRRYFWVHPYTRTLYWTEQSPAEAVSSEGINKSAFIQDILVVDDDNPSPPGLYHFSIVVQSLSRDVKFTATSKEQHDTWTTALGYLVNRELPSDTASNRAEPSDWRQSIRGKQTGTVRPSSRQSLSGRKSLGASALKTPERERPSISARRSMASLSARVLSRAGDNSELDGTPRARGISASSNTPSLFHRRDTAAREYMEHWEILNRKEDESTPRAGAQSSMSLRSGNKVAARNTFGGTSSSTSHNTTTTRQSHRDPRTMSAEEMLAEDEEKAGYEGLDNVRACCNGKHDVGSLAHHRYHQHNHSARQGTAPSASSVKSRKSHGKLSTPLSDFGPQRPATRSTFYSTATDGDEASGRSSRTSSRRPQTAKSFLAPLDANVVGNSSGMTTSETIKASMQRYMENNDDTTLNTPKQRSKHITMASEDAREFGTLGRSNADRSAPADVGASSSQAGSASATNSIGSARNALGRIPAKFDKMMQIRRGRQSSIIR